MKKKNLCAPVQRATATERCQCNLSIVSCLLSYSKLWSVSIDQRKNLLPLTFDSSIDHFLRYTVKGKYSDSTQGSDRSHVIRLMIFKHHFPQASYHILRFECSDWRLCLVDINSPWILQPTVQISNIHFFTRCLILLFFVRHWFNLLFHWVGGSTVLCRSCKVIIRSFSIETQCDLSAVMKVSGNLSHMSAGHLHTLGPSVALSWRLHRAYNGHSPCVSISISSCWHFKALGLKAELTQKCT